MKRLIEAIEARVHNLRVLASAEEPDSGSWFRMNKTADALEEIKQLAIAEQARIEKELEATISEAGNVIAVSHAISIVKGEET